MTGNHLEAFTWCLVKKLLFFNTITEEKLEVSRKMFFDMCNDETCNRMNFKPKLFQIKNNISKKPWSFIFAEHTCTIRQAPCIKLKCYIKCNNEQDLIHVNTEIQIWNWAPLRGMLSDSLPSHHQYGCTLHWVACSLDTLNTNSNSSSWIPFP